ncbi:hypothetical protein [Solidesulfovibrio sp.]
MEGYTPEELAAAGLSPEEIAAMTDDAPAEGLPVDAEAQPGIPPVTTPEGEGGAPAPVAAPEVPPVAPVEGEAPTLPAEGDEPAMPAEVPPVDGEKAPVQDKTALPSDPFAAKMVGPQMTPEDYKAALADLRAKAQSGEIDSLDYADAVADLKAQVAVATFAQQNNAATDSQKWAYAKEAFRTVHPEYANPAMWGALDGMVKQLAGDPEAQKLSDIAFLSLAHDKVQEALGMNKPKEAPAPAVPAAPQAPERAPAMERLAGKLPPSLGGLPVAQSSQPENEFAGLEKLEGMEHEAEVARMQRADPAKYERWLRAGA